jgi:hypothetical protein
LLYEGSGSEIRSALAKVVDIASDLAPLEILQYEKYIFNLPTDSKGSCKSYIRKKGATIFSNSLDVADEYIKQLMKYNNRFEYIHYKKL